MKHQQDLKRRIQAAILQANQRTEQEIHQLSTEYKEACEGLASRANECMTYLNQGFRSEAVRLASIQPDVFRQAAALDFRERETWVRYAASVGVSTPELPFDAVDALHDALDSSKKTNDMLQHYRKLNVFRRSVEGREKILHQICRREPRNQIWTENLQRLKQ